VMHARDAALDRLARLTARALGADAMIVLGDPPWIAGLSDAATPVAPELLQRALSADHARAVLDAPLRAPGGVEVGRVAVLGARAWSDDDVRALADAVIVIERDLALRSPADELPQRILENISDAFVWLDADWRYRYVNRRAAEIFGRDPASLIGRNIWEEFPEGVGQPFHRAYQQAFAEGVPISVEAWYPPYRRWFENRIQPLLGGLAIFFQDVTERRLAMDEARRTAAQREQAQQIAHLGFWVWDIARDVVTGSGALHRIYGLEDRAISETFADHLARIHPDDRERVRADIEQVLETRTELEVRKRIVRPDGEVRHVITRGAVTVGDDGRVTELFGTTLDITEDVAGAEALRRSKEWLEVALDAARMGVWEWALATGEVRRSPSVDRILRLPPDDDAFRGLLDRLEPEDRERVESEARRAIQEGSGFDVEYRLQDTDGSRRWIAARGVVTHHPGGSRMIGVVFDVTAQKAGDEKQRRTAEQLRHVQKMEAIGRLAAGVAHDFNNLLTIVEGSAQIARRGGPAAELALGQIEGAVERAAALTRQLLAVSRQQPVQLVVVDLAEVAGGMVELVRRTLAPSIQVREDVAPGVYVRADRSQLEQVVLNLLVNARDAMPRGGTLGVSIHASGANARLSVSDTGVGMSPDALARVFEPFYTTQERGGGGLGLALVHGIVGQFGGHIDVTSALNRGSTFTVTLPVAEGPPTTLAAPAARERAPAQRASILLVEDYSEVRTVVRTILEGSGYSVLEAADADAALAICRDASTPIDLLLTDVQLPRVAGPELARRARELRPELRVLFMSGQLDAGARAPSPLLQKPFGGATLEAAVRAALAKKR